MPKDDFLTIEKWLESYTKGRFMPPNKWFYLEKIHVYLRVHSIRGLTIDIGNVEVPDENNKGNGHFAHLVSWLEATGKKLGYQNLRIMNILEPRLVGFCEKRGFQPIGNSQCPDDISYTKEL